MHGKLRLGALLLLIPMLVTALSGCNAGGRLSEWLGTCGAELEWVDFLIVDDINYDRNDEATNRLTDEQIGDKVGKVKYTLDDHPCSYHKGDRNGDASYLSAGTVVYALKGYKPEFRVVADHKVYEASENPRAETLGDLLDIEGKVTKVNLESGIDGSAIGDFTAESSEQFVRELLPLRYVDFEEANKQTAYEYGVFLRVHLQDGTSLRMVFYPIANAFTHALGTENLKTLIMSERARIKAAAGM